MIRKLVYGMKLVLGRNAPGNRLRIYEDDVFIVSYPKSGNTWTRFLIANLVYPEKNPDFSNINQLIPDPEAIAKRILESLPRPRYIKSHQYFEPRFPKVIYIVRDPRDVVLSEYHFDIKRSVLSEDYPLQEYVSRFVRGEVNHPYGTWYENAATWFHARRGDPRFLLMRYEDLQSQAMNGMRRIANFLGIAADQERLAFAIAQSSADRMRELEKKQGHLWSSTQETRKDKPFVRSAKAGGWKAELPEAGVAQIEAAWGGLMREMGYELVVSSLVHAGPER
jgi:sulfotransferase family protein